MKRIGSDIPKTARERVISEYRREGPFTYFRLTRCIVNRRVVGKRGYDNNGMLRIETPLKNGKKHGRELIWDEDGCLECVEPYVEGQLHGVASQYRPNGEVMGTYRFVRGTGFDIWRQEWQEGRPFISEIHSMKDSMPDGYEWWLNEDQNSVWHECHWLKGKRHGIERSWKGKKFQSGCPKYWINDREVTKRLYLKAIKSDDTLPKLIDEDNDPRRQFPTRLQRVLHG